MGEQFDIEIAKIRKTFDSRKKRNGLTVSAVARAADCSRVTVYVVLNGGRYRNGKKVRPSMASTLAVAAALGLQVRVGKKGAA